MPSNQVQLAICLGAFHAISGTDERRRWLYQASLYSTAERSNQNSFSNFPQVQPYSRTSARSIIASSPVLISCNCVTRECIRTASFLSTRRPRYRSTQRIELHANYSMAGTRIKQRMGLCDTYGTTDTWHRHSRMGLPMRCTDRGYRTTRAEQPGVALLNLRVHGARNGLG
eukprot:2412968-Rhodomonas_salina.3